MKLEMLTLLLPKTVDMTAIGMGKSHDSVTAEDINTRLPALGRATIFRTIKLLQDTQKLCKTVLFDGTVRYSLDTGLHHHHLICVKCGDIKEMRSMELERVLRVAAKKIPDQVVGHSLEIYRICSNCS